MTGMKQGTGDDPFAEDDEPTVDSPDTEPELENTTASETSPSRNSTADSDTRTRTTSRDEAAEQTASTSIPYIFKRDSVQEDRERVPLFLMEETKGAERKLKADLEEELDDNVALTDIREATYLVGMNHLSEVVSQLEDWGYDYED